MGGGDEVVGDADDSQRPGDLLPGQTWHALAVPARRHLAECADHLAGQVQTLGQQPAALAQIRRHQLELPLASDQRFRDKACALGQRPVVRKPTREVAHVLGRLRSRAGDLRPALEVDLIAPDPACEVRRAGRAADVRQERDVVDVRALLALAAEAIRQLERREADPELVLERLAQAKVGRQRERRHQLCQADRIVGAGRLHSPSLERTRSSPSATASGRLRPRRSSQPHYPSGRTAGAQLGSTPSPRER